MGIGDDTGTKKGGKLDLGDVVRGIREVVRSELKGKLVRWELKDKRYIRSSRVAHREGRGYTGS